MHMNCRAPRTKACPQARRFAHSRTSKSPKRPISANPAHLSATAKVDETISIASREASEFIIQKNGRARPISHHGEREESDKGTMAHPPECVSNCQLHPQINSGDPKNEENEAARHPKRSQHEARNEGQIWDNWGLGSAKEVRFRAEAPTTHRRAPHQSPPRSHRPRWFRATWLGCQAHQHCRLGHSQRSEQPGQSA